jgi:hypothetical protein
MTTATTTTSTGLEEAPLRSPEEPVAPGDAEVARWAREQARQELAVIIRKIWRRARAHGLDRGLTLSLPYFDDEAMEICQREVDVIPKGRIMFVPAFVVLAARREKQRVAAEAGMSESTRDHLMGLLEILEQGFDGTRPEGGWPHINR